MLHRISLKAPPPRIVLLPDSLFFLRAIPVAEGANATDVAGQVELALEGLAPFPLAQMFYAHHWVAGARHALLYASYRKRFSADQTSGWAESEAVIPAFAALFTAKVEPSTTLVITNEDGITALHWGERTDMPSAVAARAWNLDTEEAEKRRVRDEMLRGFGGSRTIVDLSGTPDVRRDGGDAEFVFQLGSIEAPYTREQLDAVDVRDKEQLNLIRSARRRDLLLWRAFVACAGGVALAALLEFGLVGGRLWQHARQSRVDRQAPVVAQIMSAQTLATRIDELSTKRLHPLEMIITAASKRPPSVTFIRATTTGLYSLDVEATTTRPEDVTAYQAGLRQLSELSKVEIQNQVSRDGVSTFHLLLTFKPDAFRSTTT